jgi:7-methyl-GTP pyrophosphatase
LSLDAADTDPPQTQRLILASTSRYRRELLARLRLPFQTSAPQVDESPRPGEAPWALARRLATAKAEAVCALAPDAWVIGSDQVAELAGRALGKPGTREAAIAQLASMSGAEVVFRTAVSVVHATAGRHDADDVTIVRFRRLEPGAIARYVDAEQPFDCAGSFKSEGLGIVLFDAIESQDPTALIGLPLIATARLLRRAGFALP